jgi:hypothetical protein
MKIGFVKPLDLGSGQVFPECFWSIGRREFPFDATAKTDLTAPKKAIIHLVPYANLSVFQNEPPNNEPLRGVAPMICEIDYYISELDEAGNVGLMFNRIVAKYEYFSDAQIIDYTPEGGEE